MYPGAVICLFSTVDRLDTVAQRSQRRRERVAPFLDADETLVGSFVAGKDPTLEVAAAFLAGLAGYLLASTVRPVRSYTVAVTYRSVVLIRNSRLGRPKFVERRISRAALGPIDGSMDCTITIGDEHLLVPFSCASEARELVRQCQGDPPPT